MNTNTVRGLTSIIVPCWNQVEFTQQCIAALKGHTRPAWELIVVDNGSTDGTGTYLAGVRDMSAVPVTVVSNATNVGFPAAINQGLRLARGIPGDAEQRCRRDGWVAGSTDCFGECEQGD